MIDRLAKAISQRQEPVIMSEECSPKHERHSADGKSGARHGRA
ncbi:hypothetical protein VQ045_08560 [Aurantimonas sp. E1-2-R+4]